MPKLRWISLWHQLDEIQKLSPKRVLEIGPGPGLFKKIASSFNIQVDTLDHDHELDPDYVGSVTSMPFANNTYDVVCAFQVLEHLPYEVALQAFAEMLRVSQRYMVISLPDSKPTWRYMIHIPALGDIDFLIPKPRFTEPLHEFDGEHYWELGKMGFNLKGFIKDTTSVDTLLIKTYRVKENPYHRFFVYEKLD